MKKTEISLLLGLLAAVALAAFQVPFSHSCERLRSSTLRLHVIANSDAAADQSVKLEVRDAVLDETARELTGAASASEAADTARGLLADIERAANAALARNGVSYAARASVERAYFPAREYDGVTLPEGVYTAVRVRLGEARGQNWWCVVYPSLCLPAAERGDALNELDETERELAAEPERYVFRFKIEEALQRLFGEQKQEE